MMVTRIRTTVVTPIRMNDALLALRSKALLVELALASALGTAVLFLNGGLYTQSYVKALIFAAILLVPLELLRQTKVLQSMLAIMSRSLLDQARLQEGDPPLHQEEAQVADIL